MSQAVLASGNDGVTGMHQQGKTLKKKKKKEPLERVPQQYVEAGAGSSPVSA